MAAVRSLSVCQEHQSHFNNYFGDPSLAYRAQRRRSHSLGKSDCCRFRKSRLRRRSEKWS